MPNHRRQDRELDALYATLPRLDCQGYCYDSCGPIDTSIRERARIVERARKPLTCSKGADGLCSLLTDDHRCGAYEIRPMICRLWGLVRGMPCPYGCRPEGGLLDDREGLKLIIEADRIGGTPNVDEREHRIRREMIDALSEEEMTRLALQTLARGRATVEGRGPTLDRVGHRAPFELPGIRVGRYDMAYPKQEPKR
jgi:hypothetical protein